MVSNIESKAWQGETPKKHPAELLETVFGSTVGVQFDGFFWGWWLLMIDKLTLRAYCKYTQRNEIVKMGIMQAWSLRNSKNICCTRLRIDGKQFFLERKPALQGTWRNHEGTQCIVFTHILLSWQRQKWCKHKEIIRRTNNYWNITVPLLLWRSSSHTPSFCLWV